MWWRATHGPSGVLKIPSKGENLCRKRIHRRQGPQVSRASRSFTNNIFNSVYRHTAMNLTQCIRYKGNSPPSTPLNRASAASSPVQSYATTPPTDAGTVGVEDDGSISTGRTLPEGFKQYTACRFELDWNRVYLIDGQVRGSGFRLKEKRVLHRSTAPSDILKYDADILDDRGRRLWVCQRCHLGRQRPDAHIYI